MTSENWTGLLTFIALIGASALLFKNCAQDHEYQMAELAKGCPSYTRPAVSK